MARPKNKIPSYLPHPASGQARVRVNGHDIYLGPYGSPESKQAYARFIAENVGNGQAPDNYHTGRGRADHCRSGRQVRRFCPDVLRQERRPHG